MNKGVAAPKDVNIFRKQMKWMLKNTLLLPSCF